MKKFKFVLNSEGVSELLKSKEMTDIIKNQSINVQNRAGSSSDFEVVVKKGKKRTYSKIQAKTKKAIRKNLKENTLVKALFGGK